MSRDTFSLLSNSNLIVKSECLLSETLFEINAVIKDPKGLDCINYVKVRSHINLKTLKAIIKNCHCAVTPILEETPEYFSYQYSKQHAKVYISKKTGRLLVKAINEDAQRQAFMLLRFLTKYGYVEGFKRTQRRKKG